MILFSDKIDKKNVGQNLFDLNTAYTSCKLCDFIPPRVPRSEYDKMRGKRTFVQSTIQTLAVDHQLMINWDITYT